VPTATPRTSIIVSSSASSSTVARRGRGTISTRGDGGVGGVFLGGRGVKGGYYCVVMAVACAIVLAVG
jgi:hypothetical protein